MTRPRHLALAAALALSSLAAPAQRRPMDVPSTIDQTHRTRLILKDGTYQLVLTWKVDGGIVRYRSAERNGVVEEIPLKLVDVPATQKWEKEHDAASRDARAAAGVEAADAQRHVTLSPELAREEADRAARTPEVATNLRLPDEDSVLVLDTFRATPELVPLSQQGGDLNKQTAHNILRAAINPLSSAHQIVQIKGEKADVQLHVPDPVFYIRIGPDDEEPASGYKVDTHGQTGRAVSGSGSGASRYVITRVDVRKGLRVVASFSINMLGGVKRQGDVIELTTDQLPGGHWLRLKPTQPLEFGEYALMEVVSDREVNLDVWDFGVHPTAPDNPDALRPETRKPVDLERRR